MENNLNENFILSRDQIKFIDDGVINKRKKLMNVIKKLVKQDDNNFHEENVEQIMESYREIKRQEQVKAKQYIKNRWTQEEIKIVEEAIEEEIKNKGKNINIGVLAEKLLIKEQKLKRHTYRSIMAKIYELIKKKYKCDQGNNKDLSKKLEEALDKCFNSTKQFR